MSSIPQVIPGGETRFWPGNEVGVLLLHGFNASPMEVTWLGEHLHDTAGYTIYAPRLAGHATDTRLMQHLRWQDWYDTALRGYWLLRQTCEVVFVGGLSMGGLLATLLAIHEEVDGLLIGAAPFVEPNPLMRFGRWLALVRPFTLHPAPVEFEKRVMEEEQRRGRMPRERIRYERWSSRAVYELYALIQVTARQVSAVRVPTVAIYARKDTLAPLVSLDYLRDKIPAALLKAHVLPDSGHIVFMDVDRDKAFQYVEAFVQERVESIREQQKLKENEQ